MALTRHWPTFLLVLLVCLPLAYCGSYFNTWRFRMTIEVMTPEGLKTGSSVMELRTVPSPNIPFFLSLGQQGAPIEAAASVEGHAPIVDLGPYGWVVAPKSCSFRYWQRKADLFPKGQDPRPAQYKDYGGCLAFSYMAEQAYGVPATQLSYQLPITELPYKAYPQLIWLPARESILLFHEFMSWQLPKLAGGGVRLIRITIQPESGAPLSKISDPPNWFSDALRDSELKKRLRYIDYSITY